MNAADIAFRPITAEDNEFHYTVYAKTRTEELALVDWTESQKDAFLRAQFNAQHQVYQETYRGGDFLVILRNGQPIGRLYVARWDREIRIVDISLLRDPPKARIASAILNDILPQSPPR